MARLFTNASFLSFRCERCDKKVDTVKRLCVKKLPPILVIQLKRFDYDYERMCLIKFNDYFEFPRDLGKFDNHFPSSKKESIQTKKPYVVAAIFEPNLFTIFWQDNDCLCSLRKEIKSSYIHD